jgi:flagellar biosynthetic protein FlhB
MAGNEQEQDRSEPATPFKLQEARRRGQVARSMELSAWLMLVVATMLGWQMFDELASGILNLSRALFDQAGRIELSAHAARSLFTGTLTYLFSLFGTLLMLVMVAAALSVFAQVGPVFSFQPLKPDMSRLNPAAGFKRIFNARMIYELVKTLVKLALVSAVVYFALRKALPTLASLPLVDVRAHPSVLHEQVLRLALAVLAALGAIAIFDFGFVRLEYARKMRMSRREVREEMKRRDGDPQVKAKIRQLQREAARRGASLQRIPDADVLITNPTHLSIAIRYERGKAPAPMVIAKGSGEMALRMREKARQCRVPVTENRPIAQLLFRTVPIDGTVPPQVYPDVARILMWAYKLRPRSA